jgi:tRNA threonylcarbamoyladenosine biosynthesis protein TsaB
MLILGINTVGDVCEAALVRAGVILAGFSEPITQGHDARLALLVERAMHEASANFADLSRIAVVVGPGSFTGVRVGVAFARGLSLALDAPSVGVTSLEALDGLPDEQRVLGLLPAKRRPPEQTWWAQLLDKGRGAGEPVELDAAGIRDMAKTVHTLCGGLQDIPELGRQRIVASPTAAAAAAFAARLPASDLPPPRPVYVREPDAKPMVQP